MAFLFAMAALLCAAPAVLWASGHEKVLHSFQSSTDGHVPLAGLVLNEEGNLYGTTSRGGRYGGGKVFELQPTGKGHWKEKTLYDFSTDGAFPESTLVFDDAGNLYGTTDANTASGYGYGVVFELSPKPDGSWSETVVHGFSGGSDGAYPVGDLVFDLAGNLCGVTEQGGGSSCGSQTCGTIFKLTRSHGKQGWTETIIYAFSEPSGRPASGPIVAGGGTVYGTTYNGGTSKNCYQGCGTVFELKPAGRKWEKSTLYSFQGGGNGYRPESNLVLDAHGNLYGSLSRGGNGGGLIFELQRRGGRWQERMVYNFCTLNNCADGRYPNVLTIEKDGSLYGATQEGGNYLCGYDDDGGCGTVFKLFHAKTGWMEMVLYAFQGGPSDGEYPMGGVTRDAKGQLFGTTFGGGGGDEQDCTFGDYGGCGTVFEVMP
jgi:uncharacterized repeat protein (TIGR03803 family)